MALTPRENFLRAMRREDPAYIPVYFQLCPSLLEEFRLRTGQTDYEEYYQFNMRTFRLPPTQHPNDYSKYHKNLKPGAYIDEWGVGHEPGSVGHFNRMVGPMADFDEPQQVWDFPLPDMLADYRWEPLFQKVQDCKDRGYSPIFRSIQIFEYAWYLRGLDNMLMDMMADEDMAEACLRRMADFQVQVARRVAECGFDVIVYGDDIGTQKSMMMSMDLWRRWLKPDMKRAIAAAKEVNPSVLAYYHSDGVIYDAIPELIEIGVDILNPIQPECIDPDRVKALYGDRLSLWGCVGTQTTMPFGTQEDVDSCVRHLCEVAGKGAGLCIAPTHVLEPEVPYENLEALIAAVRKYGQY